MWNSNPHHSAHTITMPYTKSTHHQNALQADAALSPWKCAHYLHLRDFERAHSEGTERWSSMPDSYKWALNSRYIHIDTDGNAETRYAWYNKMKNKQRMKLTGPAKRRYCGMPFTITVPRSVSNTIDYILNRKKSIEQVLTWFMIFRQGIRCIHYIFRQTAPKKLLGTSFCKMFFTPTAPSDTYMLHKLGYTTHAPLILRAHAPHTRLTSALLSYVQQMKLLRCCRLTVV